MFLKCDGIMGYIVCVPRRGIEMPNDTL